MNLYIGDTQFGHRAVINFDHRPFLDVDEMDNVMIDLWNGRVAKNDDVHIVGDLIFKSDKPYSWYLKQLRGRKHLIVGNHDRAMLKDSEAMSYFESVDVYKEIVDDKKRIILFHYPILQWNAYFRESWHIYGHVHGKIDEDYWIMRNKERALNSAACINNYTPCSFRELVENNKRFKELHPVVKE